MKYPLITTVLPFLLLSVAVAPAPVDSAGEARDRAGARQDRGEVPQDQRATRDDAKDLATLRDIQVELARARVESDIPAVALLDERVMAMLQDEQAEDAHARSRARVASEWARLEGHYERQDLERRVLLLDELVDFARAEAKQSERGRGEDRRETKERRREGGGTDRHQEIQPRP